VIQTSLKCTYSKININQ